MKPFLKWAGGKQWLIPKIKNQLPKHSTYYEPFIGSGAVFFGLEPKSAVIADINPDLINCYKKVKGQCQTVINILKQLKTEPLTYYRIREKFNKEKDPTKRAAYFIYLNKMGFNGLYRVNEKGEFNVPVGKRLNAEYKTFDADHLMQASRLLKKVKIKCCDFAEAVKDARRRSDLVYFDPPYVTTHMENGFIKYNSVLFHQTDELRLSILAEKLARQGTKVIVSNAAHPLIKELYNGAFYKTEIDRASLIAGDPNKRSRFMELLVTTFPINLENERSAPRRTKIIHNTKRYSPDYNPKCRPG